MRLKEKQAKQSQKESNTIKVEEKPPLSSSYSIFFYIFVVNKMFYC